MSDERQTILRAAEAEFAGVGLEKATVDSVAARAGVDPGAVRALFVDKSTLLGELLREATDPLVSGISLAVSETDDTRELLRRALEMYDRWMLDHPDIVRIMVHCVLEGPQSLSEIYRVSLLPSDFFEHLQQLIDDGRLRCRSLFTLSLLFDSLIIFPHMLRPALQMMEPGTTAEGAIDERLDAMIDLFENGLYSD